MAEDKNKGFQERASDQSERAGVQYFVALDILRDSLNKVADVVQNAVDTLGESQKVSNALGRSLDLNSGEIPKAMGSLEGTISQKLSVAFEALSLNVDINSKEVLKLAEFQKITGQDYKASLKFFQLLQNSLDVSVEQSEELANTLTESSTKYGVSTEFLVNALQKFAEKNKDVLGALGTGGVVSDALARVQAAIGPGLEDDVNQLFSLLFSKGTEFQATIANLGLTSARQLITTSSDADEVFKIAMNALRTAGETQKNLAGGLSGEVGAMTQALDSLTGNFGFAAGRIFDRLDDVTERAGKTDVDITQKILMIFNPIQEAFLTFVDENKETINKMIEGATNFVKKILTVIGPVEMVLMAFGFMIGGLVASVSMIAPPLIAAFKTVTLPIILLIPILKGIVGGLMEFKDSLAGPIGFLKAQFNILVTIVKIVIKGFELVGFAIGYVFGKIYEVLFPVFEFFTDLLNKANDALSNFFNFGNAEEAKRKREDSANLAKAAEGIDNIDSRGRNAESVSKAVDPTNTLIQLREGVAARFRVLDDYEKAFARLQALDIEVKTGTRVITTDRSRDRMDVEIVDVLTRFLGEGINIKDISAGAARQIGGMTDAEFDAVMTRTALDYKELSADAINRILSKTDGRID
jgi:hypothetical protein